MSIASIVQSVKDVLFPVFCLGCQKEGIWVCDECFQTLFIRGEYYCPVCHREQGGGACCAACECRSSLSTHIAMMAYREDHLVGRILRTFKYEYAEEIFSVIERMMNGWFASRGWLYADVDLVVPVPLHRRRFAERGFNQAGSMAAALALIVEKPCADVLRRSRYTLHQALLSKEDRQKNVAGAFALRKNFDLAGQRILLVDDIFTTGSTLQECARVLKTAGAARVSGFTIARG